MDISIGDSKQVNSSRYRGRHRHKHWPGDRLRGVWLSDLNVFLLILLQYMQELATQEQQEVEEHSFTLNCFSVQVSASLRNPVDAWEVTPLDDGLVSTYEINFITSMKHINSVATSS